MIEVTLSLSLSTVSPSKRITSSSPSSESYSTPSLDLTLDGAGVQVMMGTDRVGEAIEEKDEPTDPVGEGGVVRETLRRARDEY